MTAPGEVLRLAATGMDVEQIAARLSIEPADVITELARSLDAPTLTTEQERAVERAHLDALRRSLIPVALGGETPDKVAAARLLVRIHSARALLLGLLAELPYEEPDAEEEVTELDRIRARRADRRAEI